MPSCGVPRAAAWFRCRRSTGSRWRSCAASTGSATSSWTTRERFAQGFPANNALLWGARGMGKSSLVKAVHAEINRARRRDTLPLKLVEIHREEIESLPDLMTLVRSDPHRFIVFCDDLSFDGDDTSYKSLKAVAGGRDRGPARQRAVLRHLEPPPPVAAGHDGQRALHGDQPGRGRGGEGLPVRPLRPLARVPQVQPGRVPGHGLRLHGPSGPERRTGSPCGPRPWNGRPPAARAPGARPGSSSRTSRAGSATGFEPARGGREGTTKKGMAPAIPGKVGVPGRTPMPCRPQPPRWGTGSTGVAPLRSSKWSCGDVTLPDWPETAITWPRLTGSPRFTFRDPLWA